MQVFLHAVGLTSEDDEARPGETPIRLPDSSRCT